MKRIRFWSYIDDGEFQDHAFETRAKCDEYAQAKFEESCMDCEFKESQDKEIEIVSYVISDIDGEPVILTRETVWLEYEYYHGDFAEHAYRSAL